MSYRILVATASPTRRKWYCQELERRGCDVEFVSTAIDCVEMARDVLPHAMILESFLPWGGSDGVLAIREEEPELKSIHAIVIETQRDASQTYRLGAYELTGYWKWPVTANDLVSAVQTAVERASLARLPRNTLVTTSSGT